MTSFDIFFVDLFIKVQPPKKSNEVESAFVFVNKILERVGLLESDAKDH